MGNPDVFGRRLLVGALCVTCLGIFATACVRQRIVHVGPDVQADLVVVFKLGTEPEQVVSFWEGTLQTARADGRGGEFLAGIESAMRCPRLAGHEAIAIMFHPHTPETQRKAVRARISASSLVQRVYENVAPADIKAID